MERELAEVMEKGRLMHNRRGTERATFHGMIHEVRQRAGQHDKEIKRLKYLIEEERNDDFIDLLEGNAEERANAYSILLEDIKRLSEEVRDAKRFNVYKQL